MTTTKEQLDELTAQVKAQAKILEALDAKINPKPFVPMVMPRFDLTEGMSMDRETMLDHARAVDGVKTEDLLAFQLQRRSQSPPAEPQVKRGSGWADERPLENPAGSGQKYIDAIVDAQDRRDLVENAQKLAQAEAILKAAKEKTSEPTDDDAAGR